jgi:predicted transcriptional regulator
MPRSGITVYLPRALEERVQLMAKEQHRSESSLIAEAVKARIEKKAGEEGAISERQRLRTDARLDKAIGEILIFKEVLLLFVRVWLEHNPPIDENLEESAAASADARFERFLDYVAQGLAPGKSIASRELVTPALAGAGAIHNGGLESAQ